MTLGTLRIIFISHGQKYIAPLIGFIEINIWLLAIGQIMTNINNLPTTFAYAGGFAIGNLVGILLEEKISLGLVMLRITCKHDSTKLVDCLRSQQYGVTTVDGEGSSGPVKIILAVVRRKDLPRILRDVHAIHPHAFYTIEEVKSVAEAQFPLARRRMFRLRKGK